MILLPQIKWFRLKINPDIFGWFKHIQSPPTPNILYKWQFFIRNVWRFLHSVEEQNVEPIFRTFWNHWNIYIILWNSIGRMAKERERENMSTFRIWFRWPWMYWLSLLWIFALAVKRRAPIISFKCRWSEKNAQMCKMSRIANSNRPFQSANRSKYTTNSRFNVAVDVFCSS